MTEQHTEIDVAFTRGLMVFKRTAPEVDDAFPTIDAPRRVGGATE